MSCATGVNNIQPILSGLHNRVECYPHSIGRCIGYRFHYRSFRISKETECIDFRELCRICRSICRFDSDISRSFTDRLQCIRFRYRRIIRSIIGEIRHFCFIFTNSRTKGNLFAALILRPGLKLPIIQEAPCKYIACSIP